MVPSRGSPGSFLNTKSFANRTLIITEAVSIPRRALETSLYWAGINIPYTSPGRSTLCTISVWVRLERGLQLRRIVLQCQRICDYHTDAACMARASFM